VVAWLAVQRCDDGRSAGLEKGQAPVPKCREAPNRSGCTDTCGAGRQAASRPNRADLVVDTAHAVDRDLLDEQVGRDDLVGPGVRDLGSRFRARDFGGGRVDQFGGAVRHVSGPSGTAALDAYAGARFGTV
jgi:hypothetical protein